MAGLLIPIGLVLVVLFMCTSADSMSYAAAMVVSGRNEPPAPLRLFWALMIGSLTLVLLRIGTGLGDSTSIDALQAFIVITAVPVTPLVLMTLWSAPRLAWKELDECNNNQPYIYVDRIIRQSYRSNYR